MGWLCFGSVCRCVAGLVAGKDGRTKTATRKNRIAALIQADGSYVDRNQAAKRGLQRRPDPGSHRKVGSHFQEMFTNPTPLNIDAGSADCQPEKFTRVCGECQGVGQGWWEAEGKEEPGGPGREARQGSLPRPPSMPSAPGPASATADSTAIFSVIFCVITTRKRIPICISKD